ncbi:UDP-N-acetylglucosamine 2-epimerase (non-hydrolysing) [Saccharothrix saharensis]|uniref:UDP-N-acetylglucosamine 2-epimerase (Non-hydrolysing) n=1 Tax=Saccharothrix saharensis TaxID=571190 RepID=A0A543J7U6_9PSEU|nr:UDP-N-acetylglucosamine 2-epimerase [Saccharothrix saharensis]TQM78903.1 UDP-N-acetylglucosamine 2-epimerase (non-hydrolysing) [Saccharothrix saharensis]
MTAVLEHTDRRAVPATPPPAPTTASPRPGGVAVVLGARPEVFKLAPVLAALGDTARLVRCGRHLPPRLSAEDPLAFLHSPADARGCGIAVALEGFQREFAADRPDAVLVPGETDVALAAALAADARGIPLVRVDAGVRGHDLPDAHNRVLLDRLADVLCAATPVNLANLEADGLGVRDVRLTGNTTVESVRHRLMGERDRLAVLRRWGLEPDRYVLATLSHPDNLDDEEALFSITNQLAGVVDAGHPVVLPVDPRTRAAVSRAGVLSSGMDLRVVDRLWHSEFLALAKHAGLLVTDSGAVQEEATALKRPVLVVRRSTERPEVLRDFGRLVGPHDDLTGLALDWLVDGDARRAALVGVPSPFGDARSGERIAAAVRDVVAQVPQNVR